MALLSGILKLVAGAAEITAGVLMEVGTLGGGTPLAVSLISSGAGMMLWGVGSLVSPTGAVQSRATTQRNPTAPHRIIYGRSPAGGKLG